MTLNINSTLAYYVVASYIYYNEYTVMCEQDKMDESRTL